MRVGCVTRRRVCARAKASRRANRAAKQAGAKSEAKPTDGKADEERPA